MNCPNCSTTFEVQVDTCTKCGYPFSATEAEKSEFIGQQVLKVGDIDDGKKSVTSARNILFLIGAVNVLASFFQQNVIATGIMIFIGLAFALFGFLVPKSPLLFLSIALTLLVLLYAADLAADASAFISRGFLIKIAYVTALIFAIVRVKKAEAIKNESEYLGKH